MAGLEFEKLELDTDHRFYLLDGQVINNGRAFVLEQSVVGQQRRDSHFGRHADVAQRRGSVRSGPLGNVQQPFGAGTVFKQVAHLKKKKGI